VAEALAAGMTRIDREATTRAAVVPQTAAVTGAIAIVRTAIARDQ